MMMAAIACNTTWGTVDAVMYLIRNFVARGRRLQLARMVRSEPDPVRARAVIAADLTPLYRRALGEEGLERIRAEVLAVKMPAGPALAWRDGRAALLIFTVVFLSTFPLVLPYLFFDDLRRAMRVSAAVAIAILFLCGYSWGKYTGARPMKAGLVMVVIGGLLEAVIVAMGG